jgi:hypothetical protein
MMRRVAFLAVAACVLAACDDRVQLSPTSAAAHTAGCEARATAPWRPLSGMEFSIVAATRGETCAEATAAISISDTSGRALYQEQLPANQVMTLAYAESTQAMQVALAEWIEPTGSTMRTSSELPVWSEGAAQPALGEFAFYPEMAFGRTAYDALRTRDVPLLCFVQGMESLACLALENGALTKVGVQTFPG